ncbi:IRE1A, partial [Symbiodinium sp. KB8]
PSQAPGGAGAWQSVQAVKAHPIEVCRQVVAGVAHLHTHGVAHRDIKPNNILLKRGVAKLCDFGLARSAAAERSRHTATTAGGTPGWQPREVVAARMKGRAVTGGVRADLFGVGCVLFFILSGGAHPFGEAVLREGHILKDHFSPFRALNASSGTQDIRLVSHDAASSSIAFTAHFSDIAKRLYGVLPDPAVSPALQALEATYTRMEGAEADWAAKLAAVDAAAGRTWPAAGGGSGGGEEEWKSPLGYLRMFKRRKAHCLGLVRAVRNIAFSHAVAYVHAGTFSSVKDAHEYWLAAFPWLPVTLYEIVVSGVDH